MRIAHVVSLNENVPPKSRNGLEFLVSWLTEELVRRGHEVTLFAPATSKTSARLIPLVSQTINETHGDLSEATFFSIWNSIGTALRENEFDLIHSHNGNASYIAPFVDIPIVETLHGVYDDSLRTRYFSDPKKRALLFPILEQASKINYVAISKKQEGFYKLCEDFYFKKYSTIHNGIPVEKFSFSPTPKDYLLYLGYINDQKGADIAVQVAKRAGMKLILAGDNIGTEGFFNEKIKPHLDDNIKYVGPVEFKEKNELYSGAKALLAPLRWEEPFGLTLVEAQACGTPVIALNKGAAAEVVDNGKTGFVVETEDEMVECAKKIDTIDRYACRKWVEKKFSVEKMTDEYENLYRKLIESK